MFVSRFLKEEWSYLNKNGSLEECPIQEMAWKNLPRKIEKKTIAVTQAPFVEMCAFILDLGACSFQI
jgi:hypothetical protein